MDVFFNQSSALVGTSQQHSDRILPFWNKRIEPGANLDGPRDRQRRYWLCYFPTPIKNIRMIRDIPFKMVWKEQARSLCKCWGGWGLKGNKMFWGEGWASWKNIKLTGRWVLLRTFCLKVECWGRKGSSGNKCQGVVKNIFWPPPPYSFKQKGT